MEKRAAAAGAWRGGTEETRGQREVDGVALAELVVRDGWMAAAAEWSGASGAWWRCWVARR